MIRDREPVVCAICRREAGAFGAGKIGTKIVWSCGDPQCTASLGKVARMSARELSRCESLSLVDAGDAAGSYLEGLGKTDIGDLSPEEWNRFLKTILTTFESKMRERLSA